MNRAVITASGRQGCFHFYKNAFLMTIGAPKQYPTQLTVQVTMTVGHDLLQGSPAGNDANLALLRQLTMKPTSIGQRCLLLGKAFQLR